MNETGEGRSEHSSRDAFGVVVATEETLLLMLLPDNDDSNERFPVAWVSVVVVLA